jgi:transcriptional regulator with XRE-family HTH domain
MGFKENLKQLRAKKGMTQSQVATAAGVPLHSYQNWESGLREPRIGALARLASALRVTTDELLAGVAEEPEEPKPTRRRKK